MLELKINNIRPDLNKCTRPYPTDAAFDVASIEDIIVPAGGRQLIHTGLYLDIPEGYEIQVRPRSGLALKHGITVLNSPGTVDEHYVDEVGVILFNSGNEDFVICAGDRIAQFVLSEIPLYDIVFVDIIDKASRGGGFGHSGV